MLTPPHMMLVSGCFSSPHLPSYPGSHLCKWSLQQTVFSWTIQKSSGVTSCSIGMSSLTPLSRRNWIHQYGNRSKNLNRSAIVFLERLTSLMGVAVSYLKTNIWVHGLCFSVLSHSDGRLEEWEAGTALIERVLTAQWKSEPFGQRGWWGCSCLTPWNCSNIYKCAHAPSHVARECTWMFARQSVKWTHHLHL